jgi:hypothetical protein
MKFHTKDDNGEFTDAQLVEHLVLSECSECDAAGHRLKALLPVVHLDVAQGPDSTAIAQIKDGVVMGVNVVSAGSGYRDTGYEKMHDLILYGMYCERTNPDGTTERIDPRVAMIDPLGPINARDRDEVQIEVHEDGKFIGTASITDPRGGAK